jgi:hypothetical protein
LCNKVHTCALVSVRGGAGIHYDVLRLEAFGRAAIEIAGAFLILGGILHRNLAAVRAARDITL